jgi:hypothetical protein
MAYNQMALTVYSIKSKTKAGGSGGCDDAGVLIKKLCIKPPIHNSHCLVTAMFELISSALTMAPNISRSQCKESGYLRSAEWPV